MIYGSRGMKSVCVCEERSVFSSLLITAGLDSALCSHISSDSSTKAGEEPDIRRVNLLSINCYLQLIECYVVKYSCVLRLPDL